jgi:hypothetical protein
MNGGNSTTMKLVFSETRSVLKNRVFLGIATAIAVLFTVLGLASRAYALPPSCYIAGPMPSPCHGVTGFASCPDGCTLTTYPAVPTLKWCQGVFWQGQGEGRCCQVEKRFQVCQHGACSHCIAEYIPWQVTASYIGYECVDIGGEPPYEEKECQPEDNFGG